MPSDVWQMLTKINRRQETKTKGRAPIHGWLYDSLGRSYRVLHRVVETGVDGGGPVLPSNQPETFKPTPGYPSAFQARSLERSSERKKIEQISKNMDPFRLLSPHGDATSGAPVVWRSHGEGRTLEGQLYVLGGNGRTLGLLMADEDSYKDYETMGRAMWGEIWPKAPARPGYRHILVRQVFPSWCSRKDMRPEQAEPEVRLSMTEATELAGATQSSLAAKETPLGESLSLVRALGFDMHTLARQMPNFSWSGVVARDNVYEFLQENRVFGEWLSRMMGAEAWSSWTGDPENTARLVNSTMIGFLPRSVVNEGFGSDREERALLSALPILVQISVMAARRQIAEDWDLLNHIEPARMVLRSIRKMTFKGALAEVERMANQETMNLVTSTGEAVLHPSEQVTGESILLALILKRGEQARDPSIPVEDAMGRYLEMAVRLGESPMQGMFGAMSSGPKTSPELALGTALAESIRGRGASPISVRTRRRATRSIFG
jgi:hypothetical protein